MKTLNLLFMVFLIPTLVFGQKNLYKNFKYDSAYMISLEVDELQNEQDARTIDLVLSAKTRNIIFSVTDLESKTCYMIVTPKFAEKHTSLDSISMRFKALTGHKVTEFSKAPYSKEIFYKLYTSVKYYYENFESEEEGGPKLYRTGNIEKDNMNYNTALAIWKEQQLKTD